MASRERNFFGVFFLFLILFLSLCGLFCYLSASGNVGIPAEADAPASHIRVVVLDAGHGGEDGGAVAPDGTAEKELNLAVAERLRALLEASGIRVVMTRDSDRMLYDPESDYQGKKKALDLLARRRIAEETENAVFISIHMNMFPSDSSCRGLQVWYSPNHPGSRPLAESVQNFTKDFLQPENHRKAKSATSGIYLLHRLQIPAVLIECGFLSNPEELALLSSPEYQDTLALNLFLAIMGSQDPLKSSS